VLVLDCSHCIINSTEGAT